MSGTETPPVPPAPDAGYEERDVNLKNILVITAAGLVFIVVVLILMSEYFLAVKEEQIYQAVLKPESAALRELRAREHEILNSYDLLDAETGRYRIPIDHAMQLMAESAYRERLPDTP